MSKREKAARHFEVYVRNGESLCGRIVQEASLEAAAIAFLDNFGIPHQSDEHAVTVFVRDLAGGGEHCFRIDFDTGETKPCR